MWKGILNNFLRALNRSTKSPDRSRCCCALVIFSAKITTSWLPSKMATNSFPFLRTFWDRTKRACPRNMKIWPKVKSARTSRIWVSKKKNERGISTANTSCRQAWTLHNCVRNKDRVCVGRWVGQNGLVFRYGWCQSCPKFLFHQQNIDGRISWHWHTADISVADGYR